MKPLEETPTGRDIYKFERPRRTFQFSAILILIASMTYMRYTHSFGFTARFLLAQKNRRTRISYFLILSFQHVWTEKAAASNSKTRYDKIQRSLLNLFKLSRFFDVLSSGHVQVVRAMYNYTAQQVLKYSDPSDFFRSIAP